MTYFCNIVEIFEGSLYNFIIHNKGGNEMKTFMKILVIFAGIILGGFLGDLALTVPALKFLGAGKELGLSSPIVLDLSIIKLTFAFVVKLNIAGILGLIASLFIIKKAM